jgi:hypothetical protein
MTEIKNASWYKFQIEKLIQKWKSKRLNRKGSSCRFARRVLSAQCTLQHFIIVCNFITFQTKNAYMVCPLPTTSHKKSKLEHGIKILKSQLRDSLPLLTTKLLTSVVCVYYYSSLIFNVHIRNPSSYLLHNTYILRAWKVFKVSTLNQQITTH